MTLKVTNFDSIARFQYANLCLKLKKLGMASKEHQRRGSFLCITLHGMGIVSLSTTADSMILDVYMNDASMTKRMREALYNFTVICVSLCKCCS